MIIIKKLAYSVKSTINFEDLIGPLNRLAHPSGMKNFSDTKIESKSSVSFGSTGTTSITLDFIGLTDKSETPLRVDRINVFDLGYDDEINSNRSNAIRFNSKTPNKRLTNFVEVKTNRALLHDDISSQFIDADNIQKQNDYVDFTFVNSEYTRAVLQARNPFTDQVELQEVILLAFNNNSFTLKKAFISDNEEGYGDFEGVSTNSTEYSLRYTPYDLETFDIDFKAFSNRFIFEGNESVDLGYVKLDGVNIVVQPGSTDTIFEVDADTTNAVSLNVQIIEADGQPNYAEVYAVKVGTETRLAVYTFNAEALQGFSEDFPGEFTSDIVGGKLQVRYQNTNATVVSVTTKSTEFLVAENGVNPYRFLRGSNRPGTERGINLRSYTNSDIASTTAIEAFRVDADLFQSVRTLVYIQGGAGLASIQQLMIINSGGQTYINTYPFLVEGEDLDPRAGIGSFGAEIVAGEMVVSFYPDAQVNTLQSIDITTYNEQFFRELDSVNYTSAPLLYGESEEAYYIDRFIAPLGDRTNNVRFTLKYQDVPIYEKKFEPELTIVQNNFEIRDHFFSRAEKLYYLPGASVDGEPSSRIEIAPTNIPGIGLTTLLPETVYAIKLDLNRFQLAATADDARAANELTIVGFGTGNAHRIGMAQKLEKTIITIDGVIQSPISTANKVYELRENASFDDEFLQLSGIGTITTGDLFLIDEEYVTVRNIGFATSPDGPITNTGSLPLIEVERGVVGSAATDHVVGAAMTVFRGSYNIVESDVVFTEAPNGKGALTINENNLVEFNSTFQGRTFLQRDYDSNVIFDNIRDDFDGQKNSFVLTSLGSTSGEVPDGSGVLIINDIYQTPTTDNNQGNNYFYTYDTNTGINSVTFTGITSENGQRVLSEFDVNQNQVPRGGLIVSLGSTPGLGYAPLYGAIIKPEIVAGEVVGIITSDQIGVTTAIEYAVYDRDRGELIVTANGSPATTPLPVTGATYNNVSGQLVVNTSASLSVEGVKPGDSIRLEGLEFSCDLGSSIYPNKDNTFAVISVINNGSFSIDVGISTLQHTYVTGGTWQKFEQFEFGEGNIRPDFVYLDGLEFSCPNGETVGLTTTTFPVGTNNFPVVFGDDNAHWRILVGVSTIVHEYVGGGVIGQYDKYNPGSGYNRRVSIAITETGHSGDGAIVEGIPGPGGELDFVVINPGSGYDDPYASAPDPAYENLPITGVFRRTTGFTTECGENLFVTCEIGAAKTTAIGRSEYFEVSNYEITNQGYSFLPGDIVEVVGLVTDKRLSQPIEPFQLTIVDTFTDNFTAWNFGELNYIDSIKRFQDGFRTRFPLIYKDELLSFEQNPADEDSAAIDLDSILLIYVNTVLQVPKINYTFEGGTSFQFTSPPLPEDDIDVYFYRAQANIDSVEVFNVKESIRPGDELQLKKNDAINKVDFEDRTRTQDIRTVTEIVSSDTVRTNIYFGNNDLDEFRPRQVAWDKQKRDVFIYGEAFSKARDSLEPIIKPTCSMIRDFPATELTMEVDSARLFEYEEEFGSDVLTTTEVRIYEPVVEYVEPEFVTTVSDTAGGTITNIAVTNQGSGYPVDGVVDLVITSPVGYSGFNTETTLAVAQASVSGGRFSTSVSILNGGVGYTESNPPKVIVAPPTALKEGSERIANIEGFTGIITGIQRDSADIKFFYNTQVPDAVSLRPGYSLVINNSKVGSATTGVTSLDASLGVVGVGTQFLDCVYELDSTPGSVGNIGNNGFFTVKVLDNTVIPPAGIVGGDLGEFSWGRIRFDSKDPFAKSYVVDGTTYSSEMEKYPTVIRAKEGLRQTGGLQKVLS